ncbi:hypothetical protein HNQ59_001924 [Chitinivorax tropicus]|uniref:Uncharacterized protein n=1 Tax=Chitinivorax tropicus TaxID=714531 RepID=A0A840MR06_9PROT|nr:hypothetical protein [Chitinivorax tropicus]MBB5018633.1 hypothetical protein [Chitinivorax tropicus]
MQNPAHIHMTLRLQMRHWIGLAVVLLGAAQMMADLSNHLPH